MYSPVIPHLQNGANGSTSFTRLLLGLNEGMHTKCLRPRKPSKNIGTPEWASPVLGDTKEDRRGMRKALLLRGS